MDNREITIQELKRLQDKYDDIAVKTNNLDKRQHYSNLVNTIEDVIEDLKAGK